jgi:diadenosine tetraphosphate (Ap4A) HIT family hydrolase/protein-tyrosine-phosphatase
MLRVLFVCEGNRVRSQMAEAMLRHHGAGRFEVFSAGVRPGDDLPEFTRRALAGSSYAVAGLRPKHYSEFAGEEFDFLIVLCDTVRGEAPPLPAANTRLDWPVEDPADAQARGVSIEQALHAIKEELRARIVRFMEAQGCIFCAILRGRAEASFLYRDDHVAAFMDIRPVTEGHALVIPVEHFVTMDETPDDIAGHMTALSGQVARGMARAMPMDGYNLFVANGEHAGQEVFHVHLHVIPRYRGDGFGIRFPEGYGRIAERPELERLAESIRDAM